MTIQIRSFLLITILFMSFGCVPQTQTQKDLKDLNRVISGIETRKEIELRVIENEQKNIRLLRENYTKVNSDGMRDKISREITMKESVVDKAKRNKENQEELLNKLHAKRDSIVEFFSN